MTWQTNTHKPEFTQRQRQAILTRDKTCQHCHQNPATQADHITPAAKAARLGWTTEHINNPDTNGQGLCRKCHEAKTATECLEGRQRLRTPRRVYRHPADAASPRG